MRIQGYLGRPRSHALSSALATRAGVVAYPMSTSTHFIFARLDLMQKNEKKSFIAASGFHDDRISSVDRSCSQFSLPRDERWWRRRSKRTKMTRLKDVCIKAIKACKYPAYKSIGKNRFMKKQCAEMRRRGRGRGLVKDFAKPRVGERKSNQIKTGERLMWIRKRFYRRGWFNSSNFLRRLLRFIHHGF